MAAPRLIPLVVGLVPLIHAVRPVDTEDGTSISEPTSSHRRRLRAEARTELEYAAPTRSIAVNPTSAFISLETNKTHSISNTTSRTKAASRPSAKSLSRVDPVPIPSEGVDILPPWMDYLFFLLDEDGGGTIEESEWKKLVKGPWESIMLRVLGGDDKKIDEQEFTKNWDTAVTEVFNEMGAESGKIDKERMSDMKQWKNCTTDEVDFAKKDLSGDGSMTCESCMDRAQFEEWLYTVMFYRGLEPNNPGHLKYEIIEDAIKKRGDKLGLLRDALGDKVKFDEAYKNGMKLGDLLTLFNEQPVFRTNDPELTQPSDEKVVEKAKDEKQALAESEGRSGSVRAVLGYAAAALTLVCA